MKEYLRWSLQWGQKASALLKAAADAGVPPPESAIPPDLPDNLTSFVRDFWILSTCRGASQSGPTPIPWTAIDQFAERHGYTDNLLIYEDFTCYMHALDSEYLAVISEEIQQKQKQAEAKGKSR